MIKNIRLFLVAVLTLLISCVSTASALSIVDRSYSGEPVDYSGTYLFTVTDPGNDNLNDWSAADVAALELAIEDAIGNSYDATLTFYAKVDKPGISVAKMTVDYNSGNLTGEWSTDDPVEFYTVKAATEFALYWLDGGADKGFWSTQHQLTPINERNGTGGNQPEISHLSTWNATVPVPEPSTLILLGVGLAGFGYWRRRKS